MTFTAHGPYSADERAATNRRRRAVLWLHVNAWVPQHLLKMGSWHNPQNDIQTMGGDGRPWLTVADRVAIQAWLGPHPDTRGEVELDTMPTPRPRPTYHLALWLYANGTDPANECAKWAGADAASFARHGVRVLDRREPKAVTRLFDAEPKAEAEPEPWGGYCRECGRPFQTRGFCRLCGRYCHVRKDGTVRQHRGDEPGTYCRGSGLTPR